MVFQLSKSLWWNCSSKEWSILKRSNVNLDKFRDKFDQFVSLFLQYGHIPFDVQLLKGVFKCRIVCKTICVAFLCILVICVVWTTHHLGFAMTKRGDVLLCRSSRLHQRMKSYLCSTSPLSLETPPKHTKTKGSPSHSKHPILQIAEDRLERAVEQESVKGNLPELTGNQITTWVYRP